MTAVSILQFVATTALLISGWLFARKLMKRFGVRNVAIKVTPFRYPTHPVIEPPKSETWAMSPIESVRQLVGSTPRRFDDSLQAYLSVLPPDCLKPKPNDEQWLNVKSQHRLRREGAVVWATIVQANGNLFKRNNAETGASVIYSADPWFDRHREALGQIAQQCFALKGTSPTDRESAVFARMLTDEMIRGMRMKVPSLFTGQRRVYHSSMLMPRKHLPKGFLTGVYFPVWIDPDETGAVVMVPAAFWPPSLLEEWGDEEAN